MIGELPRNTSLRPNRQSVIIFRLCHCLSVWLLLICLCVFMYVCLLLACLCVSIRVSCLSGRMYVCFYCLSVCLCVCLILVCGVAAYLLAYIGYVCLLCWTVTRGMNFAGWSLGTTLGDYANRGA